MECARAEPVTDGTEQHVLESATMDGQLGPRVPGVEAAGLAPDLLTPARAIEEERRRHRLLGQLPQEPECVQLAYGMGQQVDADAQRPHLGHRVEELDLCPHLVQAECRGQTTDACPHHHGAPCSHSTSWTSMVTMDWSRRPVETASRSLSQARRPAAVVKRTWVRK